MANDKTDDDINATMGFMNIANSLTELAGNMQKAQENGEPVDVFAAFKEAMSRIQNPVVENDVQESDTVA